MRRRYDTELYRSRIEKINKLMPDACIGVDVIVGFPGEDDDLFLESMSFLENLNVSYLHVFTYSERDNTHAISLPYSVDANVRAKRSKLLRLLSSRKKAAFYERNVGSIQDVLFESEEKDGFIEGFSSNYIRFRRPWDPSLIGTIVKSIFIDIDSEGFAV